MSIFTASHVRKNTRLSTPVQLQCLRSGAWEPGNEAMCIALFPSHSQILSHSREEKSPQLEIKSGSGLGTRLQSVLVSCNAGLVCFTKDMLQRNGKALSLERGILSHSRVMQCRSGLFYSTNKWLLSTVA